ncbi:zinc-dependent alcohol dehydrogenase family protein [Nakamurella leprariae]|uniref:Zinc-dependent alcohol dehydrogenase family protein n=1 Tax=Nakamurella leprariae TaxID=2803911 RepID=A0A938YFY8_9ACTN|nr:zinc-dependent alcohol dehydrogenase family protein [Nakamurella leprariae]MBM9467429.1 zinc-dependent alcohol dehydrogenase family protein [Nakamurella leprariae]
MRAVVYAGPRDWSVTEIPTPVPAPNEVLIKVRETGVCGTDLHIHEGGFYAEFPLIPGHEVVGEVAELGADVPAGLKLGEAVTVNPNAPCGVCEYCQAGQRLVCPNLKGVGTNYPGTFAEYLAVPHWFVYSTEGIPDEVAVFTEPMSCAVHGADVLDIRPGSTALVFGAGPTGLLLAQLLQHSGASHVTVAASSQFKLDRAEELGVDATLLMDRADLAGSVERLREVSGGGFDVVVEATGALDVAEACVPLTRNGGQVMIYGVTDADDRISISPYDVFRREITIKGSFAQVDDFPGAVAALRNGRVKTDGLVTHRFPLEDYGKALEALQQDRTVHKIVLVP